MNRGFSRAGFILAGIRRRPGRNLATFFCFAFIAANIFFAQYLLAGTAPSLSTGTSRMGADLLVIPASYATLTQGFQMGPLKAGTIIRVEPSTLRFGLNVTDTIRKVPEVATISPQLYVATLPVAGLTPGTVDVYGIDPVTDFTIRPWLKAPLKNPLGHGEILAGDATGAVPGSTVRIGGSVYTVAGRLEPTRSAVDQTLFMTMDDAYALAATPGVLPAGDPPVLSGMVNAILVGVEPGHDPALTGARVQQPFSLSAVRVLEKHGALQPASQAVRGLPAILAAISIVVILAALPLIALVAAMAAHERRREIGLLAAMGAHRSLIFFLVLGESLVLAVAGGAAGTGLGLAAFLFLHNSTVTPFLQGYSVLTAAETAQIAAGALCAVVLIGSIAALWPAYRSSRMDPVDAIRTG